MTEGEEEADADWLLAFLDKETGSVVDGGNMISVEGMAQSEAVRQSSQASHCRKAGRVTQE
jgi:hypothetical protein